MREEPLAGQWVGPMPVKSFIEGFLDKNPDTLSRMPGFRSDPFDCLDKEDDEEMMCDTFIRTVETSLALPGFKLVNTSSKSDANGMNGMKKQPAISCYESGIDLSSSLVNYEEMELIIELKPSKEIDVDNSEFSDHCWRQLVHYTELWLARQHRTHCFLLWLGYPHARIIRMDRSGGIVSAKFNYRTESDILLELLWRFSQSTPEARGHDTTVAKASPDEAQYAKIMLTKTDLVPTTERGVLKIQVPNAKDRTKARSFLVWGSLADPQSATGRATRGYPAVDIQGGNGQGSIVFLKDSWRSCEDGMEKESAILEDLNLMGCRNVPGLICGDDLEQFTVTKLYAEEAWNLGRRPVDIVKRVHTRFVQKEVGYHLEGFRSSREFLQAIYDAFLAHQDAYEKCGILHCDISAGNVLMRKNGCGGGFLNDWDLAKRIHKEVGSHQARGTGTWQFMSTALLEKPDSKVNSVQDDMESFLWLGLYHILRYVKHNFPRNLKKLLENIFDEEHADDTGVGPICGGWGKSGLLGPMRGQLGIEFTVCGNEPLTFWIQKTLDHWEEWYILVSANRRAVRRAVKISGMSQEEAVKQHLFDVSLSPMRDHREMISTFEEVLTMNTWPKSDKALDFLSL